MRQSHIFLGLALALLAPAAWGLPAFPGAEGFGAKASGGRGGNVYKVTTLAASGAGSLQWALDRPGPRIIVFAVSGVIEGDVRIPHGDVTIAGQTAPGAGITIHGHLYTPFGDRFGNFIIRHLRVRPPNPDAEWPANQHDAIQFSTNHTIILDHIDASHGADETIDLWGGAHDITLQWSAITYPIYDPANGWTHHKGLINHRPCEDSDSCDAGDPQGGRISIHHNLFAHARNRTPALSTGPADVVNNVVYNGREGFVHHNVANGDFNLIGNVIIDGPSASLAPLWFDPENGTATIPTRYWVWDNWVEDPGDFTGRVDNPFTTPGFDDQYTFYCCGIAAGQFNASGPFDFQGDGYRPITIDPSNATLAKVLPKVGALPRDIVNRWAVSEVEARNGAWGNRRPADWLDGLTPTTPPQDNDNDGMADAWEQQRGLDPGDGSDHRTVMPSGYTAIEEYINGLADALTGGIFSDGFESGDTTQWSP
ncbi:MAG: pectate lyase precursor [Acidobacteriota bacterium]